MNELRADSINYKISRLNPRLIKAAVESTRRTKNIKTTMTTYYYYSLITFCSLVFNQKHNRKHEHASI